jgi:DNA (cytosine-5)-methyltransferase 1
MPELTIGSLFTGIGGFDLAFERVGAAIAWQVEKNAQCIDVLGSHYPGAKRFEDVCNVGKNELSPVDIICGGFPCQDLSVAGRREGLAGARSGLWFEFYRIITELSPRWVIIENVPGLLSSDGGRDFAIVIRGLEEFGYFVAWRVLDTQYFGVPQRRRRVFIVGYLGDGRAAEILFERDGVCRDTTPFRRTGQDIAYALAAGAGGSKFGSGRDGQDTFVTSYDVRNGTESDSVVQTISAKPNGGYSLHYQPVIVNALSAHLSAGADDNQACGGHIVIGTLAASGAGTERPAGQGNEIDFCVQNTNAGVRRLMPIECERLQGFPDHWTKTGASGRVISDSARYRMLGNAVSVPVVEWIAKRISNYEKSTDR